MKVVFTFRNHFVKCNNNMVKKEEKLYLHLTILLKLCLYQF